MLPKGQFSEIYEYLALTYHWRFYSIPIVIERAALDVTVVMKGEIKGPTSRSTAHHFGPAPLVWLHGDAEWSVLRMPSTARSGVPGEIVEI